MQERQRVFVSVLLAATVVALVHAAGENDPQAEGGVIQKDVPKGTGRIFGVAQETVTETRVKVILSTVPYICITTDSVARRQQRADCTAARKKRTLIGNFETDLLANAAALDSSISDAPSSLKDLTHPEKKPKKFTMWETTHAYISVTKYTTDSATTVAVTVICGEDHLPNPIALC